MVEVDGSNVEGIRWALLLLPLLTMAALVAAMSASAAEKGSRAMDDLVGEAKGLSGKMCSALLDIAIFIGVRFSVRFLLISRVDCLFLEKTIGAVHLLISSWGVFLAAAVAAAIAHCVGCRNGDCWSSMNGRGVDGGWGGGGEAPVLEIEELEVHESPGVQLDGLL